MSTPEEKVAALKALIHDVLEERLSLLRGKPFEGDFERQKFDRLVEVLSDTDAIEYLTAAEPHGL